MAIGPVIARVGAAIAAKKALTDEEKERPITVPVDSTAISQIAWADEIITVTFRRDGSTHQYPGSRELFEDFVSAPSIGQYFNKYIR